ncbi:MAG: restriction endonuclease [Candidatus Kariarchaeaceae archaeon]|jgi:hypothetical protein
MEFPEWLGDSTFKESNPYLKLIYRFSKFTADQLSSYIKAHELDPLELEIVNTLQERSSFTKEDLFLAAIQSGCTIEQITKYITWNDFEQLVAAIFSQAGWESVTNFRFFGQGPQNKERKRFEIDVLVWKKPYVGIIDCKRYSTTSQSLIRNAVDKQKERGFELFEMIPIIHDSPEIVWSHWDKAIIFPMIVTWRNHNLTFHDEVLICATSSLLDLLANFSSYVHSDDWFSLKWELS